MTLDTTHRVMIGFAFWYLLVANYAKFKEGAALIYASLSVYL